MNVLYLTGDLLFSSRVTSAAGQLGITVKVLPSLAAVREHLATESVPAVLLDLEHPDADPAAVVSCLSEIQPRPLLVAYGPHVKETLLGAAQAAGVELVWSRGQFHSQIAGLFQQLRQTERPES